MTTSRKQKAVKCAAPDCDERFVPTKFWQKFHSKTCADRELQRRRRAKLAAMKEQAV